MTDENEQPIDEEIKELTGRVLDKLTPKHPLQNLADNMEPCPPEFAGVVDDEFFDLLDGREQPQARASEGPEQWLTHERPPYEVGGKLVDAADCVWCITLNGKDHGLSVHQSGRLAHTTIPITIADCLTYIDPTGTRHEQRKERV